MVPAASRGSELLTLETCKTKLDPAGQGGRDRFPTLGGRLALRPLWICAWLTF